MKVWESFSEEETYRIGKELAKQAKPGDIVALKGDLGVGKTVFARGFAAGLGIEGPVSSPTFTFVICYAQGRLPLYHFDLYRIADPDELDEIGYEEFFYGSGVCLVEWPERAEELFPANTVWIRIEKDFAKDAAYRKITMED